MDFSENVKGITQNTILPKVFDTFLDDNWITFRYLSNARKWRGVTLDRPIKVSKSDLGGSFSGLDTHSTSTTSTRATMSFTLSGYEMPIAIAGMDKAVNRTEAQVLDLVQTEIQSAQEDALDDIGDMVYGDGTGNSNKDFLGWDALNDDSTSVTTIGGLSRSTYTTLQSTRTASGGTMNLKKIGTLVSNVSSGSSRRRRPSCLSSDETVRDLYEEFLTPTQQANYDSYGLPSMTRNSSAPVRGAELKGAAGYTALSFRGIPWIADEKSTSQTLWATNDNYMNWYGLQDRDLKSISFGKKNIDSVYSQMPSKNVGFQWTGFLRPINQYGEVAHIYLLGQFVSFNPKFHGRLTGITGI